MLQQSNHTVKSALEKIRCDGISKGRETCTCFLMEKPYWGKLGLYVWSFYHYHGCVVASFPCFPPSSFWSLAVCKNTMEVVLLTHNYIQVQKQRYTILKWVNRLIHVNCMLGRNDEFPDVIIQLDMCSATVTCFWVSLAVNLKFSCNNCLIFT